MKNFDLHKNIKDQFDLMLKKLPAEIKKKKKKAFDKMLDSKGLTRKNEDYKYSDLSEIFKKDYQLPQYKEILDIDLETVFSCDVPKLDTDIIYTVNGFFHSSKFKSLKSQSLIIKSLKEAIKEDYELIKDYFDSNNKNKDNALYHLNTAYFQDGYFIYIPKNHHLERPLQIINILTGNQEIILNQRNLIILEENSSGDIITCDHTLSEQNFLNNTVTETFLGKNANLSYYNIQNQHDQSTELSSNFIEQSEASHVHTTIITLHGGMIRNNLYFSLNGQNADNEICGIYIPDKNQHVDNFVEVYHKQESCISNQLYRGILDGKSQAVFQGKIIVEQAGQKTRAYQSNNNILLSDEARMNSKPQLEIYADDVKCSHAATEGQLDEEALFYLKTRGINENEARFMLMRAFAREVVDKIRVAPLRERIDHLVEKRLRGELVVCGCCNRY